LSWTGLRWLSSELEARFLVELEELWGGEYLYRELGVRKILNNSGLV
jgi:hypothetical protein